MTTEMNEDLIVSSPAFKNGGNIPGKYTCEGAQINPPLLVRNIPSETKTLALIVEDPDALNGAFTHWLVWNIEPLELIAEDSSPGTAGVNSFGKTHYGGPCPLSGTHRYFFCVFALNARLHLGAGADKQTLRQAMQPHLLATGELMGKYGKKRNG